MAVKATMELCHKNGIEADTTIQSVKFTDDNLAQYDCIIFLQTTGDVLNASQQRALQKFIRSGKGFVGIHSASDTEHHWPWYGKLVGAYFKSHPRQQETKIYKVESQAHMAIDSLPLVWNHFDEWYNFVPGSVSSNIQVLLKVKENEYEGGEMGDNHPIAWYQNFEGGRSFYTALGHTNECYSEKLFLNHILGGIQYAIGNPESNSTIGFDKSRFTYSTLASDFDEPMELAVTPDKKVFVVERKGSIKLFDPETKDIREICKLDVWTKYEDGLLGITLDPNFKNNGWLYLFYSPNIIESVQYISRFTFVNDSLDRKSEKVLLKIPVQRLECCHSGGSLTFDDRGNLFISIGDNTNPFKSDGYSPTDERPDRFPWDAQKSSANSNDFRGKILRIKPENNGTYSIPEGNLFPKNGTQGKPEIYVMGCRNPYRIAVDSERYFLFWGDVGPDAGKDSVFGPRGYDEVNRAKAPGFFGWPYFIGNNFAYSKINFDTKAILSKNIPGKVENNSPNNTGIKRLPFPQPAFIFYPYAKSDTFPMLGKGGRCAMAGPVFHKELFTNSQVAMPGYFDDKFIFYDWIRNWIYLATLNKNGDLEKMEQVFEDYKFSKPTDMEFGPDGELYVLEYGENWFMKNADARLTKIEYINDNRSPVAKISANITQGGTPLKVAFKGDASFDLDLEDTLTYDWRIFSAFKTTSTLKNPEITFTKPGVYNVLLIVSDSKGKSSCAETIIKVGNHIPELEIETSGNQTFFWPGSSVFYSVKVDDKEDGKMLGNDIPKNKISVAFDRLSLGYDLTQTSGVLGHQIINEPMGLGLIKQSDCKSCHHETQKSVGPSYEMIANRYASKPSAVSGLARKIINGGSGVWGDHGMSAHPQLTYDQTLEMVKYILTLQKQPESKLLPTGKITFSGANGEDGQSMILTATYTDNGAPGLEPASGRKSVVFKNPRIQAEQADSGYAVSKKQLDGLTGQYRFDFRSAGAFFMFRDIDLNTVKCLKMSYCSELNSSLEIRTESVNGPVLASLSLESTGSWKAFRQISIPLKNVPKGKQKLFFMYKEIDTTPGKLKLGIDWIYFDNRNTSKNI